MARKKNNSTKPADEVLEEAKVEETPIAPTVNIIKGRTGKLNLNSNNQFISSQINDLASKYDDVRTLLQNIYNQGYVDGARGLEVKKIEFDDKGKIKIT